MSDDLMKRLRMREWVCQTCGDDRTEAADRIEFLERVLLEIANAVGDPSAYWIARVALDKTDE